LKIAGFLSKLKGLNASALPFPTEKVSTKNATRRNNNDGGIKAE